MEGAFFFHSLWLENDKSTIKFSGILESFSLIQSIAESTHKSVNTLDLVIHNPEYIN